MEKHIGKARPSAQVHNAVDTTMLEPRQLEPDWRQCIKHWITATLITYLTIFYMKTVLVILKFMTLAGIFIVIISKYST